MRRVALLTLLTIGVGAASACKVPVFRYALDHWRPDLYTASLPPGNLALAGSLEGAGANLRLTDGNLKEVVIRFPAKQGEDPPATLWRGPTGTLDVKALCHSPARSELVRLLASGTSAVWVLLDGDEGAEKLLRGELARLEKELELPPKEEVVKDLRSAVPFELRFAVLKVRRADAAEAFFVRQLLAVDEDLGGVQGPVAIPVIGRGRALWALHGDDFTAKAIASTAGYLCAACSCTVKSENPGTDLLLAASWTELLDLPADPDEKSLPIPAIPPGVKDDPPTATGPGGPLVPLLALGTTLLAVVAAVTAWRRGRG